MDITNKRLLKVLLVEDDEDDYISTFTELSKIESWDIELEWVSTYEEACARFSRHRCHPGQG